MKVAILSINLGEYYIFWDDFFHSAEKNFLIDCKEKEYFVFTDSLNIEEIPQKVHIIQQEDMGWPNNTMKRFHLFNSIRSQLKEFDYIFFANANTFFKEKITSKFINERKNIIVVEHPGYHFYPIKEKPFERRKESLAYIPEDRQRVYVQGAFYGGKRDSFLEMASFLDIQTEVDLNNGIIAIWHDESFLNSYVAGREDVQILGWQYLYFEEYILPYDRLIVLRNKRAYLSNKNGRFLNENFFRKKIMIQLRNIKWRLMIFLGIYKKEHTVNADGNYIGNDI